MIRLSTRGAGVLDALLAEGAGREGEARELADRLVIAGLLHPCPPPGGQADVVIPAHDPPPSLAELVASLRRTGVQVTVVDDGSADGGAASRRAASVEGARLVARGRCAGPAAARNAGVDGGEVVCFLDADVLPPDDAEWMGRCVAHFADPAVALVAPRVTSADEATGPVARFERESSPLDQGGDPGLVGPGRRLSYAPAAALFVRRSAFLAVGGFDETLRRGEDVDLVARLALAGHSMRYEPAARLEHAPRDTLGSFARQRFGYGTAAAALEERRPGSVAPFSASRRTAACAGSALLLVVAGLPRAATGALLLAVGPEARWLRERLGSVGFPAPTRHAAAVAGATALCGGRDLLTAVRRAWWPALAPLLASPLRRGAARLLLLSLLAGHAAPAWRAARGGSRAAAPLRVLEHLLLGALGDVAYSSGVLAGCARHRSPGALLPVLRDSPRAP